MSEISYLEILLLALPETVVVLTALVVLAADLFALRAEPIPVRMGFCVTLAMLGCVAAGVVTWSSGGGRHR